MLVATISAWMIAKPQSRTPTRPAPPIVLNDLDPRMRPVSQTVTTSTRCPRISVEVAVKDRSVASIRVDEQTNPTLLEFAQEHYSSGRVAEVKVACFFEGASISLFTEQEELILTIPVGQ